MKYNQIHNDSLYTFFCRDNFSNISLILRTFDGINILHENGFFLSCAISKDNFEVCKALLDYFEIRQFPEKNAKYEEVRDKLIEILENITSEMKLSSEMKEILSPYIDFEGSEHDTLNDSFSDIDQTTFIENLNKDAFSKNLLNEEILRKFDIEIKQNSQIKTMENLLDFGDSGTHYQAEEHDATNIVLSGNLVHEVL